MKLRPLKYEAGRSVVSDIICLISIRAAIHPNPKKNGISKSHQSSNSTITNLERKYYRKYTLKVTYQHEISALFQL